MPFPLITYLIILAISIGISYLLRDKPADAKPPGLDDIDVPTAELGTPYNIIFGQPPRYKSAMVLWYGDFYAKAIKVSGTTIGYAYNLGMHLGLCHANIDGIKQVWVDDRVMYPTLDDSSSFMADNTVSFKVSQGDVWGGRKKNGGIVLDCDVLYGESSQVQNTYLMAQQGGANGTPTYRGITSVVFNRSYWGKSPRLPYLSWVVKRTNQHHDGTAQWYSAKAVVDSYNSLNIIHVIRECLTSTVFGKGISTDRIDSTTFEAAADTLYTEGVGIGYKYHPGSESIADFIVSLEEIMDGILLFDHSVGKYKIKLIRDDYVLGSLTTYTEDDFDIIELNRPTEFQTPSETTVFYTDIKSAKSAPAKDDDIALIEIQGMSPTTQEFNWPMIVNPTLANTLASREQDFSSRMGVILQLSCKRTMYNYQRGDLFVIQHSRLTTAGISSMTVRVISIDRGKLEDGEMIYEVIEEVFETASPTNTAPGSSQGGAFDPDVTYEGLQEAVAVTFESMEVSIINESVS